MPHMMRHFIQSYTFFLIFAFQRVEKAKIHSCGVFGKYSEVDSFTIPGCAKRVGLTRVNLISHLICSVFGTFVFNIFATLLNILIFHFLRGLIYLCASLKVYG